MRLRSFLSLQQPRQSGGVSRNVVVFSFPSATLDITYIVHWVIRTWQSHAFIQFIVYRAHVRKGLLPAILRSFERMGRGAKRGGVLRGRVERTKPTEPTGLSKVDRRTAAQESSVGTKAKNACEQGGFVQKTKIRLAREWEDQGIKRRGRRCGRRSEGTRGERRRQRTLIQRVASETSEQTRGGRGRLLGSRYANETR